MVAVDGAENNIHSDNFTFRPLESAEENLCRLGGGETGTIKLPYSECCPVLKTKHLHVQCPNCPTQFCSVECLK